MLQVTFVHTNWTFMGFERCYLYWHPCTQAEPTYLLSSTYDESKSNSLKDRNKCGIITHWHVRKMWCTPSDTSPHSPRDQDSVVMMSHPIFRNTIAIAVLSQDRLLPLAETVQRFVSMMVNLQVWLQNKGYIHFTEHF